MDQVDLNKNLIVMLGLEDAPEEKQAAILEKATDLIMKNVMLRLMENLPQEDVAEANRLAEENPEAVLDFLASKTEDFAALVAAETERFKNELALASGVPENLK